MSSRRETHVALSLTAILVGLLLFLPSNELRLLQDAGGAALLVVCAVIILLPYYDEFMEKRRR